MKTTTCYLVPVKAPNLKHRMGSLFRSQEAAKKYAECVGSSVEVIPDALAHLVAELPQ